jgi:hypothetical protein
MRRARYNPCLWFFRVFIKKNTVSVYRSYFKKNNTLIQNNYLNVSQNPVGEVSYGTNRKTNSRVIFKVDLDLLANKLQNESIDFTNVVSHTLKLTNTIALRPNQTGGLSYSSQIERATSFGLDLFTLLEDWDEGGGYTFQFNDDSFITLPSGASNWYFKSTNTPWILAGAFVTGSTGSTVIGSQVFPKGNENLSIDVTDYINGILYSGNTDYGLGLKMSDLLENTTTLKRRSVAFHLKNTHTCFDPYIETVIDDSITDDRNHFYMDKDNELYLYSNQGDVNVTGVTVYDYEGNIALEIGATGVTRVRKGVYKINVNISSDNYPDAVIFNDVWKIVQNGKNKEISLDFYLVNSNNFYSFGSSNRLTPDNYHFSYFGINSGEHLKRGDKRRIELEIKQLYKNLDSVMPLNLEYRLFIKQSNNVQIDIIPFTKIDRTAETYEFILDTSWLIPQDYHLEVKISDGRVFSVKAPTMFTIISDDAFTG